MRTTRTTQPKLAYYGGYPVSRPSEKLNPRDSDVARTPEQEATRDSNIYYPRGYGRRGYEDQTERKRVLNSKSKRQKQVDRKAEGDFPQVFALGYNSSPNVPSNASAHSLDWRTTGAPSDTLGMIHTGSAELRQLVKRKKRKGHPPNWGPQGSESYLEGGELPSSEGEGIYRTGIKSKRQILGRQPGVWGPRA